VAHVVENAAESRYELVTGDGDLVGHLAYRDRDGVRVLVHTEVDEALEGRGLGSELVRGTLDDARARGLKVAPTCPFVRDFIRRHPRYADLVDA
jgi:predicted GNAT family acetyltransferase